MAILTILSTVYLFCLANFLALEALDLWLDAGDSPMQPRLDRVQFAVSEVLI